MTIWFFKFLEEYLYKMPRDVRGACFFDIEIHSAEDIGAEIFYAMVLLWIFFIKSFVG